jgi:hypothetical protein
MQERPEVIDEIIIGELGVSVKSLENRDGWN